MFEGAEMSVAATRVDRRAAREWYRQNRARTRAMFDLIEPRAYYARPIALRNPVVFYEGHLPAFSIIAFINRGLGRPGVDPRLEALFARGIDPESVDEAAPRSGADTVWPSRDEVLAFAARADALILDAIETAAFDESRPAMRHGEALYTALEHEAMHHETLAYMWNRLPHDQKVRPAYLPYERRAPAPPHATVVIPAGHATLGAPSTRSARSGQAHPVRFGWDNEFEEHSVFVEAFDIDVHSVTNADYLPFVEAGHVEPPAFWLRKDGAWHWRGMFEDIPLPPSWPVYASYEDAAAYARLRGRRVMSEAEFHRAAYGAPTGDEIGAAAIGHANFASWHPVPAGSRPAAVSPFGVHDLVGNGWEWTSTIFAPFPGFEPMASYPEYSADFFDGQHYVLKGASPVTARELIRRSFRNWFRPNYPYVYAKFRTVGTR